MSFRRKVVVAAALALFIWGFGHGASSAEPRDKPLPPFAKFAKGLFSGNQDPDSTAPPREIHDQTATTPSRGTNPTGSPQLMSQEGSPASTAITDRVPVASPSIPPSRPEDSTLRATVEKLKALRRDDSTSETEQEQQSGVNQTADTASESASQRTAESSSQPEMEVPLSELPGADLKLYSTPPYPTKITHRGLTDHASTRTESLHNALHRLRQERQEAENPTTNLAKNQLRDQPIPTPVAEEVTSSHGEVPIANAIAGDLESRRPAPVIRMSDLASRPSRQENPLRERGPEYRSLRVSDWRESPTSGTTMATATSPSTVENRLVEAAEVGEEAVVVVPVKPKNPAQFSQPISEPSLAEKTSSPVDADPPTSSPVTENRVDNPYVVDSEIDSPRLAIEQTGGVPPNSVTYFANPSPPAIPPETSVAPDSEVGYTKILTQPEAPAANFAFSTRLSEDQESTGTMVSNTWITPVTSMTEEDPSPQPASPDESNPTTVAQAVPAENSELDSPTAKSKVTEPKPTSYRTMTIPSHSRSLIRPGRVVEVSGHPDDAETVNTGKSNHDVANQEAEIDPSTNTTSQDQAPRKATSRRGPVIKPSPRPIELP
ncbi:MAG: hypothetical protein WD045_09235 [Pirellulaceae bacterium]